jgi:Zn-dependent protease with chaperone function
VYFSIPITRDYWLNIQNQCWEIRPGLPANLVDFNNPEIRAAQVAFEQCRAPAERSNAAWIVGGVILLLSVAGLIYWTFPARKIRRERLVPLTAEDAPEVVDYLARLCRARGLSPQPVFLWNPLNRTAGGLAFGRLGKYYVSLTGGLVTQFYTDLPAFRAVVLHELAHLRNADVDKTYFAVSVWQAFIIAALLPFLVTIFENEREYVFNIFWRVLALAILVYLMRNAVLRTREMYADVRASLWDGSTSALSRVLESNSRPGGARWRTLWQVHPDPGSRRQVLEDPNRLLPMGFWDAFATGIAAAIALPNIIPVMAALLTGTGSSGLEILAAVLVVSPFVVGVVGLGAWRTTFAALERGKARRNLGLLGLGLGLGILLGVTLAFTTAIPLATPEVLSIAELAFNIAWGLLLLISLFFFVKWIATGASAWLEVAIASRSPRFHYIVGLTIAGGVLVIWLGFLFYIHTLGVTVLYLLVSPLGVLWSIVQHPLTLIGLVSLWAFPLAAWSSRQRVDSLSGSSWAVMDGTLQQPILMRKTRFRPGIALAMGLLAGLLYCVFLLFVRIGLRISLSESVRSTEEFRLIFFLAQVGIAAVFQTGVAAIVAAWVRRWGAVHGLFSAFVAGCVMTIGILAVNLLFGGTIDSQFTWSTFSQVVNEGALMALPAVWVVSTFAGWVRRMRGRTTSYSS